MRGSCTTAKEQLCVSDCISKLLRSTMAVSEKDYLKMSQIEKDLLSNSSGENYASVFEEGVYCCTNCGCELYNSEDKLKGRVSSASPAHNLLCILHLLFVQQSRTSTREPPLANLHSRTSTRVHTHLLTALNQVIINFLLSENPGNKAT